MKYSLDFYSASTEYSTFEKSIPAPYFRHEFEIGEVNSAEITICGLGYYELFINGKRITKGLLSPYISNPDDYLYYDNYDVKPHLANGKNVIGVVLGNGMQNSFGGMVWDFDRARWRSAPKFAMSFEAETKDGKMLEFGAESFKCADSPIILDDLRIGEFYDARLELDGWNEPEFDDSEWRDPIKADTPRGEIKLCEVDPILPMYEQIPCSIRKSRISIFPDIRQSIPVIPIPEDEENNGGYLYEFPINSAGLCRLKIKNARRGQKIVMQFAENLAPDGGLDLRSTNFLPMRYEHRDIYICKGNSEETYMPMFTYHGFKYVLVMGLEEEQATEDLLTYVVMNTALEKRAEFKCSDEIVNKIWDATTVSNLANFYHFPTDCPHREKNGWTGDASLSAEQMLMSLSCEKNLKEWMNNVRKAMVPSGEIYGVVPTAYWGLTCGPAWDGVIVNIPYYMWIYRGDREILKENATAIVRYLNFLTTKITDKGVVNFGINDWVPAGRREAGSSRTPSYFTATVTAMDICRKASEIFDELGMKYQKVFADTLYSDLRSALRKYAVDLNTLTVHGRCITTQAMAIYYDVFENGEKQYAFDKLVKMFDNKNGGFDCGCLGIRILFHTLSDFGRADLAYKLITRTEFPGYGYWIVNGRTSLGEQFIPVDEEQSSLNHHFFGDVISWFMKNLAGINLNPYHNNVNEVRFAPKFIAELDNAEASMTVPAGEIKAEWHRDGENVIYTVTVPDGMSARIMLPEGYQTDCGSTEHYPQPGTSSVTLIPENRPDKLMF